MAASVPIHFICKLAEGPGSLLTVTSDYNVQALAKDPNGTTIGDQGAPGAQKKSNSTGTIVGAVVGVVGGLAVIGLLFWLWRRRRQRRRALSDEKLRTDPYRPAPGSGVEDMAKIPPTPSLEESGAAQAPGAAVDPSALASQGNPIARPFLQEEDAEDVAFDVLPPRYRERHYREPADIDAPPVQGESPGPSAAGAESSRRQDLALKDEYLRAIPDRPRLKQDYDRAFVSPQASNSRAISSGPSETASGSASGGSPSLPETQGDLRRDYKRAFGSAASGESGELVSSQQHDFENALGSLPRKAPGGPRAPSDPKRSPSAGSPNSASSAQSTSAANMDDLGSLRAEYKRAFGSGSNPQRSEGSSEQENGLIGDYKKWFP